MVAFSWMSHATSNGVKGRTLGDHARSDQLTASDGGPTGRPAMDRAERRGAYGWHSGSSRSARRTERCRYRRRRAMPLFLRRCCHRGPTGQAPVRGFHPGTGAHGGHHVSAPPHHRPPPRAARAEPPAPQLSHCFSALRPTLSKLSPSSPSVPTAVSLAMQQEDEDMEEEATEAAIATSTGRRPTATTDTALGAAEDPG